jgi:hypothetical protein
MAKIFLTLFILELAIIYPLERFVFCCPEWRSDTFGLAFCVALCMTPSLLKNKKYIIFNGHYYERVEDDK